MSDKTLKNYYIKRKRKLLRRFDKVAGFAFDVLMSHFEQKQINTILEETRKRFIDLIPDIPYVGGRKNFSLKDLIDSFMVLALYENLKKHGLDISKIGQIIYETREKIAYDVPKFVRWAMSKLMFTRFAKRRFQNQIEYLRKKQYKDNWFMEYVEGDGEDFDWGMNFYECAVQKIYAKYDAEDIIPYICLTDYVTFNAMNDVEFKRTCTLSGGDSYCDFRFKKGGKTPRGWPPEKMKDFAGGKELDKD